MDSLEFNKIAGGVLSALLVAFGAGTTAEIFGGHGGGHGDSHGKPGYVLPVEGGAAAGGKAAEAKGFDAKAVLAQLKSASVESGQAAFKKCSACHSIDKDGKPGTGPNLWGVIDRPVGGSAPFTRYSQALKGKGGNWTYELMASYLHDPKAAIPGNQMAFAGIKSNDELADVIAYLRAQSDKPAPLPN